MTTAEIKSRLHEEIEHSDEKLLRMIYLLLKEYQGEDNEDAAEIRKQLVREEREKYLAGEGRSYNWEEVKKMAFSKQRPHA